MTSGIYQIIHRGSMQRYVGSSVAIERRIDDHFRMLVDGDHHCWRLQEAWNRHRHGDWIWLIVEECSRDDLEDAEQRWIDLYHPEDLYNTQLVVRRNENLPARAFTSVDDASTEKKRGSLITDEVWLSWVILAAFFFLVMAILQLLAT